MPAGNARAQSLQQAQTRLETLLQKLATAPAPMAEPQFPVPQMAGKQGGMVLANAIGGMISEMKGNAAPIVAGVNQMLADAQLKGFLALTAISSAFDGRGSEGQQKQQARQTATALQRGSAEAYSAIVQAMSGAKDPVVKAVDKQTKALGEPLKQMADVLIKAKPLEVIGNLFGGE
jgi:predicted lipid-binding transport protein (Tim44 family)